MAAGSPAGRPQVRAMAGVERTGGVLDPRIRYEYIRLEYSLMEYSLEEIAKGGPA
jgi:hypothetical protein